MDKSPSQGDDLLTSVELSVYLLHMYLSMTCTQYNFCLYMKYCVSDSDIALMQLTFSFRVGCSFVSVPEIGS